MYSSPQAGGALSTDHVDNGRRALQLKRRIESEVGQANLEWAGNQDRAAELGAYADFLVYGMRAVPQLRTRCVAIFTATTGTMEYFSIPTQLDNTAPVITIWHVPGHYQWLRWMIGPGPTLPDLQASLDAPPGGHTPIKYIGTRAHC